MKMTWFVERVEQVDRREKLTPAERTRLYEFAADLESEFDQEIADVLADRNIPKLTLEQFSRDLAALKEQGFDPAKVVEAEKRSQADGLQLVGETLLELAACLRGEAVDRTGLGLWQIARDHLERAMDVKITDLYTLEAK